MMRVVSRPRRLWVFRVLAYLPLLVIATSGPPASAAVQSSPRSSADEVTPEVERLYGQAKTAAAAGNTEEAIHKYKDMLKLAPHLAPAYNNLGLLYFNQHLYEQAAETLAKGLQLDPKMNTASAMLGISDYKLGRNEAAKTALERALAGSPADDVVELTLARVLIALRQFDSAAQHLRSYLDRNEKDQQAWYLLGNTYLRLSEQSLGKINAIDPNSMTAHIVAGEIDESMHNYDGALGEYKKAVDAGPDQPGAHYHLANAFWLLGKWDSARQEFESELRIDPENCTSQWKLGNTLLADNQPPNEALPHLNKAVERCPELMQARVDRADALIKLQQSDKAVGDLLLAEKESPAEPSIHFLLSKAYKATGDADRARKELETYGSLRRQQSEAAASQASDAINVKSSAH